MPFTEATKRLTERITMQHNETDDIRECTIRNVMSRIAGKWSMLVLVTLANRPYRFLELQRAIPDISHHMLTKTLNNLKRDGLIMRRVFDTRPPSVEYSVTPLGQSLLIPLWNLVHWCDTHQHNIEKSQAVYDQRHRGVKKETVKT